MADGSVYVDLSPVINAVSTVNDNVNGLYRNVEIVNDNVRIVERNLEKVRVQTMNEINRIKAQLAEMERQGKLRAALQRAITEIIRVRQELEEKFGTHKQVRDSMLGILQANDLALISQDTISKCTEQLMISAPKYWLAPCLIAISGWMANNKSLAERALKEAIRRDKEKTCLLFALVTRRVHAGRVSKGEESDDNNPAFIWLARYFSLQDPKHMKSSIIAYIDAYTNGVFGVDKDHVCDEHIDHWMSELMADNPNFAEEQKKYWVNVFDSSCLTNTDDKYQALKKICLQFDQIDKYVTRIDASIRPNGIKDFIGGIVNSVPDINKLRNDIDVQLNRLVSNYEEDEADLRDEEQYLSIVKELEGDEDVAKKRMEAIKAARYDAPVDFAQRLSQSVFDKDADISAKKTAIKLLRPYISSAFNEFIIANKDNYPKEIDLKIDEPAKTTNGKAFTWTGKTENAENRDELVNSLSKKYDEEKEKTVASVTDEEALKLIKTGKICCCLFFLAFIPLIIGIGKIKKGKAALAYNASTRESVKKYYDTSKANNVELLNKALDARVETNAMVDKFLSNEDSESIKIND